MVKKKKKKNMMQNRIATIQKVKFSEKTSAQKVLGLDLQNMKLHHTEIWKTSDTSQRHVI